MTRPIAAELLLLALDDRSGKPLVDSSVLGAGLAGAAVVDLVLAGALELVEHQGGPVGKGRLARTGRNQPSDPVMSLVAERAHGRKPEDAVKRLYASWHDRTGELKQQLLEQMAAEGLLTRDRHEVLGLFASTRWREADGRAEAEIRSRVRAVVVDGIRPDERTGALVSLLSATGLVPKLFADRDGKQVQQRAKQVSEGEWAGRAVHDAVQEVTTALTVAVTVPLIAGGSS